MFTGIISGCGRILEAQPLGPQPEHGKRLTVSAPPHYLDDVHVGDSIAINGACMTVTELQGSPPQFHVDVSMQSLQLTVGLSQPGPVNLEKALRANDRLDGHLVSGHVDGIGQVTRMAPVGESWELRLRAPRSLARFLAYKGSITVNGVSLTVNEVLDADGGCDVCINLVPHTVQNTTLGTLQPGQGVNLEIDLIARYVERMLSAPVAPAPG